MVVRRHARHQPVPARRGMAQRAGGGSAHPGRGLRDRATTSSISGRSGAPSASTSRTRRCASAGSRGVAATRGSLLSLPFPDGSFDAVTSFDVLYHRWVEDDRAAVREIVRVLRPGGLFLVRVPALKMLWGAHDEAVHSRHRYTRGEVRRLLEGEGLEVARLTYANTILFPVIAARRTLDRLLHRHGSDVGFLPAADGVDVPQPPRDRGTAGAAPRPPHRGQRLRSRAQAAYGRGRGPRLESPACGARTHERPPAGRGGAAAGARGACVRARCTSGRPPSPPRVRSRCPAPCLPTASPVPIEPTPRPDNAALNDGWRVRDTCSAAAAGVACSPGVSAASWPASSTPRSPSTRARCSSTTRSSTTSTRASTPRTATTTTCSACTAATWARSTSAT